ncbi:N-acetylmuramoyl-L-alanine amidase, partial [Bifidobacterium phasiani]
IHQYVDEADGSYSDANYTSNNSTISIEHEGGMAQGAVCTSACVEASARLCADIARRYGWDHLWHDGTNGNVWLHREIPGTDHAGCPDLTPNGLPYQQVIDKANAILEGDDMAISDDDIMRIWTHVLPNGRHARDIISDATSDIIRMHDSGITEGQWVHTLPNGRKARDIISDATSDVIRIHDTMIPQLSAQVTALTAAVEALSKAMGADPDQIAQTVQQAVKDKLDSLQITITATDEDD